MYGLGFLFGVTCQFDIDMGVFCARNTDTLEQKLREHCLEKWKQTQTRVVPWKWLYKSQEITRVVSWLLSFDGAE